MKKKKLKKKINDIVRQIELQDLSAWEQQDVGLGDWHAGIAHGLRLALRVISAKDEPEYALIDRESKIQLVRYTPDDEDIYSSLTDEELLVEVCD